MDNLSEIKLSVKIDSKSEVEKQLTQLINQLNKNELKLNVNTNSLKKSLQDAFNLDGITKSAYSSAKTIENEMDNLAESIAKVREQSERKNRENNALQEAKEVNTALNEQYKLEQQMANIRSKADYNSKSQSNKDELAQSKAINKALEDNYKATLKEAEAQKNVQSEIQKQIKLLEIKKQGTLSSDGKADTSAIDNAISKYKQLNNLSMKDLRNEISYINAELKNSSSSADSLMTKMSKGLSNIGIYVNAGDIFRGIINGAKDAVQYTIDVENSMIDLRRIIDMSDSQAQSFQDSMHGVSVSLASSNSDLITTTANFAKLGYNLSDAQTLASTATKYNFSADIGDINSATSTLISTMKAFKIEAKDAMSIGDGINKVSNDFAVSANQINDGLLKSSATLSAFGNNLNESVAMISAGTEIIQNGDVVGTAIKSSSARITTNDNALKWLKEFNISLEDQNGNLKSTYKLLDEIAPKLNELQGSTKASAMNDLFGKQNISSMLAIINNIDNMHKVMDDLSLSTGSVDSEFNRYLDSTQAKVSQLKENMGGLFSQFVNSDMTKGVVDGLNLFVTSITNVVSKLGAMPTILATVVGSLTIFSSKFREAMTSYQPTIITDFSSKLKALSNIYKSNTTSINEKILAQKNEIVTQNQTGLSFVTSRAKLLGYQTQLGMATVAENACAIGAKALGVAFNMALGVGIGVAIQLISDWVNHADIARQKNEELLSSMQQASSDITTLENLQGKYKSINEELKSGNLTSEETTQKKQELNDVYSQLIQSCPQLEGALSSENSKYEDNIELIKQAIDLKQEQLKLDTQKYITDNDVNDKGIQNQINKIKELKGEMEGFSKKSLQSDESLLNSGDMTIFGKMFGSGDDRRKYFEQMKNDSKQELIDLQTELQTELSKIGSAKKLGIDLGVSETSQSNIKNAIKEIQNILSSESGSLDSNTSATKNNELAKEALSQASKELSSNEETISSLSDEFPSMGINVDNASKSLEILNKQLKETDNSDSNSTSDIAEEYQKACESVSELSGYINTLNKEQALTPELISDILGKYPEFINHIGSVADAQSYLNDEISKQQDIATDVYNQLKADDEDYYTQRFANNQDFQNAYNNFLNSFLADGEESYNIDLSNYKTLNQLKEATQDNLGTSIENWLSQFVGSSAQGYADDFSNFKSMAEAKAEILKRLQAEIDKVTKQMNNFVDNYNNYQSKLANNETRESGMSDDGSSFALTESEAKRRAIANENYSELLGDKLDKLNEAYDKVDTSFDDINGQMRGFSGGSIGGGNVGSSSGSGSKGGSGSSGSSGKSDAEKAQEEAEKYAEKIADLTAEIDVDKYYELNNAISEIDNALDLNKTLQEDVYGDKALGLKQEELQLMKKKQTALEALNNQQKNELSQERKILEEKGFQFDADNNLINSQTRLQELADKINNKTYENTEDGLQQKEDEIDAFKDLQDELENYLDLNTSKIPSVTKQWRELNNEIKSGILSTLQDTIDKEKEMYELQLETDYNKNTKALENYKTEQEELHNQRLDDLNEELDALEENNEEEERENTLLEKKNALKQAEIDLERAKNQKTVYSYQKQDDGTYQFSWQADKDEIQSAQETYDSAKQDLKDTKNQYELEDEKKDIQDQIDEENELYEEKQKEIDKYEKALSESYERQKKLLDYYYEDTDRLAHENLDKLVTTYGDNFETISTIVNTKLDETKTKLDELNKANIGYDLETINNALSSDNIYEYVTGIQEQTDKGVSINLEGLKQKVADIEEQNGNVETEYETHYTTVLTTQTNYQKNSRDSQETYQQEYLDSFILFSAQYVTLYDKMMQLIKMITDSGTNDITTMVQGAGQQVLNELVECKKAYDKFREMWNYMNPDDTIPSVNISSVVSDFDKYKQSVTDWQKSKEELFYASNNPLYNQDKYNKYVQLSQVGMTDFNALADVIKEVKGGKTTQTININGVEVNANNGQQFINSLLTMANQKLNTN